ncbi:hypothetical protein EJB05_55991, partial [Eragrostis curvula]
DTVSGADCLVAWDHVTTPKECGGLGVRDLNIQNRCLLLKLIHCLYSASESSWAAWVQEHADIATLEGDISGDHWETISALQPAYMELTTGRLSEELPALYSHAIKPATSVRTVLSDGLRAHLQPRLTRVPEAELQCAQSWISNVTLQDGPDRRCSPLIDADNKLRTSPIYKLLLCSATAESADHLIFKCPIAASFWQALGIALPVDISTRRPWLVPCLASIPERHHDSFIHLCCWMIWKHRNEFIF